MKKLFLALVFITGIFSLQAQEPTLQETVDYVKLKLAGSRLWYASASTFSTTGCDGPYKYHFSPGSIIFQDKKLLLSQTSCGEEGKFSLFLDKIRGVELVTQDGKNLVALSAPEPFFEVWYKGKPINPDRPTKIVIYGVNNPEKLLKAFKHLCKLLDVPLVEDEF